VSRYMPAKGRRPGQSWRTFLRNHALAFRSDQDAENVSGVDCRSLHAWFCRRRLVRFAVGQIAVVGVRRGRWGGPLVLPPKAQRIFIRCARYDRDVWHSARRAYAVPGRAWRAARHRRQVTVPMRSPPREARACHDRGARRQLGPRRISLTCSGRLTRPPALSAG